MSVGVVRAYDASVDGGTSFQAHLQARRFRSQLRGRVAGLDTIDRFGRSNVVGETRRGREDQQHHGPCSTTVATRSRSWDDAIGGGEHYELRSTYGLRGVRVGEASHPGPVQTRNARRLQSLLVDSEACTVDQSTLVDPDNDSLARSRVSRHHRLRSRGERIQVSSDDEVPHTARASTRALRDAGIASFISEADRTQLDPSDCHSFMEHEQRGPDEASVGAQSARKVLGDLPSGRFAALASESGDESPVAHACRAPSDVVHYVGVAVPAIPVASAPKRLRLTSRNLHRMSQASPAVPESVCDALEFDLTRAEARSIRPILLSEPSLPEVGPPAPPPAFPPDHILFDDEDTVSMETSVPGDTGDIVSPRAPQLRAAFEAMDRVNVVEIFRHRAAVMKSPAIPSRSFQ